MRDEFMLMCFVYEQFDSIPVNVVAVQQQQAVERPRRFGDRGPQRS